MGSGEKWMEVSVIRLVEGWLEEKLGTEVLEEIRTGHYVKVPAIYRDTMYSEL